MTREELGITKKGEAYIDSIIAWGDAERDLRNAKLFHGWGRVDAAQAHLARAHARMQDARDACHEESMARYRAVGMI